MRNKINVKDIKKINIEVIPHKDQRYDTYGDYWIDDDGIVQFRVSEFSQPDYGMYTMIHEILEFWRLMKKGIGVDAVDKYDLEHIDSEEPGNNYDAPYHFEHLQSMAVERHLCSQDHILFDTYYSATPKVQE